MFQQQHNQNRQQLTRGLAIATAAVLTALALGTSAGPAAARPDAGPTVARVGHEGCDACPRLPTPELTTPDSAYSSVRTYSKSIG